MMGPRSVRRAGGLRGPAAMLIGIVLLLLLPSLGGLLSIRAVDRDLRETPRPTPRPRATTAAVRKPAAKLRRPAPTPPPAAEEPEEEGGEEEVTPGPRQGQTEITGQDGAPMVLIPAGEFLMGSDRVDDERPPHRVYVDAFYIDRHEVTNRLYRKFTEATGHGKPRYWDDSRFNGPDQPVVGVSWDDGVAYCRWAGKRLPTEAEWEKAARGGLEGKEYPWGDEDPKGRACYDDASGVDRPRAVGSYAANRYGLFDMAGNVWEWCADWYAGGYYKESPSRNPRGPSTGDFRVLRGGSWNHDANHLRCAYRLYDHPGYRFSTIGFRGVRSLR